MNKYSVLIVDDSAFMRKMIGDILNQSDVLDVIGTARNGQDALKKIEEWNPDVVTLDVEMPLMDGIETLKEIMNRYPTPVVMLSSLTKAGADKTIEAISIGAIDFIAKPSGSISLNIKEIEREIISKVEAAATSTLLPKKKMIVSNSAEPIAMKKRTVPSLAKSNSRRIVAIGSSTGGPRALQEVITHLPSDFSAPIVIVQHMPKGFTKSLSERLNKLSHLVVKEVSDFDVIENGHVYIAEGGKQFEVIERNNQLVASVKELGQVNGHQPAVDVLFNSIANLSQSYDPIAIVLTGMGSDGAKGIEIMKKKHPRTVIMSQSKETCVVYGMPQAAEKTSLVDYVLNLEDISSVLKKKVY
ncbi:chemotaxis response regulator protein-glutamate methylesterase [Gracilibacillus marinus]|jgi:two-component system, chemotaxis family, protein-glutamate methylesterase/glutaminase|uniref:Protein-glutamate methylesterase/protein-glutamine glutaminase n=1 Tax=Gracilibacillus marinus TaxID=630535 RepID=A0ABV8VXB1_9BACI